MTINVDLNDALGKALVDKFFEPIPVGGADRPAYATSGVAQLASEMYRQYSQQLLAAIWGKFDMDAFATLIADKLAADLTRTPDRYGYYSGTDAREAIRKRVIEVAAQTLGQRVVDQLDLQIGAKAITTETQA